MIRVDKLDLEYHSQLVLTLLCSDRPQSQRKSCTIEHQQQGLRGKVGDPVKTVLVQQGLPAAFVLTEITEEEEEVEESQHSPLKFEQ